MRLKFFLGISCTFLMLLAVGQKTSSQKLSETLPSDPALRYGKLPNGFTYYIRHTDVEKGRARMELLVKAGEEQEDADQLGLAHLLEHMGFPQTKHFPKGIHDYTNKMGLNRGNDINAGTGARHTNYWIKIPLNKSGLFEQSLYWLRDVAQGGIIFEKDKVDGQRGAVLGELRGNDNYVQQMEWAYQKKVMGPSRYTDHAYADQRENVQHAKQEAMERFYTDWYRPDLEALIVVGDIDVDGTERQIKELFGDIKVNEAHLPNISLPVLLNGENQFIPVKHARANNTAFKIIIKQPQGELKTEMDLRKAMIYALCRDMLRARFNDWNGNTKAVQSIIFDYSMRHGNTGNPFDAFLAEAVCQNEDTLLTGFYAFIREMERIKKYGFTKSELQKAKERLLNKPSSTTLLEISGEYFSHFLDGHAVPGEIYKKRMQTRFRDQIILSEVNTAVKKWMGTANRDVVILAPEKAILPGTAEIDNWFALVAKEKLDTYVNEDDDKLLALPLMSKQEVNKLPGLKSYKQTVIQEIGVTKWVLPSGVTVLLKPLSTQPSGHISIKSIKPPITTRYYPDSNYVNAYFAVPLVQNSGLGPFDAGTFEKYTRKKGTTLSPGNTSVTQTSDLSTALQGIYLYFTQPKKDTTVFKKIIADKKKQLSAKKEKNTPLELFIEASQLLHTNADREDLLTQGYLYKADTEKAFQLYREYFSNGADFTFLVTGNFVIDSIKPYLLKYLGNLPVRPSNIKPVIRFQTALQPKRSSQTFYTDDKDDKARVAMIFRGAVPYTWANKAKADLLVAILNMIIFDRIREKEGLAYTPNAFGAVTSYQDGNYQYNISFAPTATNIDKAIACSWEELEQLKSHGPSAELLDKARTQIKKRWQDDIRGGDFWNIYIADQVNNGKDLNEILDYEKALDSCVPKMIQALAQQFLKKDNCEEYLLLPERFKQNNDIKVGIKTNKWHDLDPEKDSVFGTSMEKAYRELLAGKKAATVIVAVLDNGVDTTHKALLPILWKRTDEKRNGYKGDYYGWNFLGGKNGDNLLAAGSEYQRIYFKHRRKDNFYLGNSKQLRNAITSIEKKIKEDSVERIQLITKSQKLFSSADSMIQQLLNKNQYYYDDIKDKTSQDDKESNALMQMQNLLNAHPDLTNMQRLKELFADHEQDKQKALKDPLEKRIELVGDNYSSIRDRYYGNNDVTAGRRPVHGTHVTGIIAGAGNKQIPIKSVKIMTVRVVPAEGDEYDKDVALGIRYAVDNGARVINMSFGKPWSPEQKWVEEAIRYAEKKNVLIIKAAGNDATNIDSAAFYPIPNYIKKKKKATNMLIVGASGKDTASLVTSFSNYGKNTVDVFAPGEQIYSTVPGNQFQPMSGTSMAAPVVSGLAAILFSYYPGLSAKQVKYIIEKSVTPIEFLVTQPGTKKKVWMNELCKSGGTVNAHKAILLAESIHNVTNKN